jgi:NitT/TauT family transport system permease protein
VWEACVRLFAIPEFLLPAPSAILNAVVQQAPNVLQHTRSTMFTILAGFAASIIVGFPLAIAIASSPLLANALYPLLVLTQSVPKVAIAPLLVIVFGANEMPRIIVTFLVAFFPLVISIAAGLLATPAELVELGRSLKASWLQELFRIRLPSATPFVFSGLKMAITFSVIGAVVGEFVAADRGLGYLITSSTAFFRTPLAFGAVVLLSIIGIVLFQIVVIIERTFFSWSVDSRGL